MSVQGETRQHVPLATLRPGDTVDCVYHLLALDQRKKKNGEPFFLLTLEDASGRLAGVHWEPHPDLMEGAIRTGDFIWVGGDVGEYNGNMQLTVKRLNHVDDEKVDLSDFLPVSPRPLQEMEEELDAWIAKVQNEDCRRLLDRVFGHPRLREMYTHAPAAARVHQAYIHGLLEHTLNVMKLADSIASVYEPVDRDILITGTLLHDIGKIRELDWKRTITYTTEGRLLGHISIGTSMVDALINQIRRAEGFDRECQARLLHLLLSHHGRLEWGSPITPKTREALVLHYADHTEAYMAVFTTEADRASERGEKWTSYNKLFESYLYATPGGGAGEPSPGDENEPHLQLDQKPNPVEDIGPAR